MWCDTLSTCYFAEGFGAKLTACSSLISKKQAGTRAGGRGTKGANFPSRGMLCSQGTKAGCT